MTSGLKNRKFDITLAELSKAIFGIYYIFLILFDANADYLVFARAGFVVFALVSLVYVIANARYLSGFSFVARMFCIIMIFTAFSLIGMDFSNSLKQITTLAQIWILCFLMYFSLRESVDINFVSKIFALAGICLFAWTMYIYGFGNFFNMLLSGSIRLGNEVSQENLFGMTAAIIASACIYNVITAKKYLYVIPVILMTILIAASGSRKAILVLPVAFIGTLFLNNGFRKIWKILLIVAIAVPIAISILSLPIFDMINSRLEGLFDFINNQDGDMSSEMRGKMTVYGLKWFLESPIYGHGLDCYKYLAYEVFGSYSYAHNNYIELLVDTGIIGTTIYYSVYVYLLRRLVPIFRQSRDQFAGICIIVLVIMLATDIGAVSYISKTTYVYWGICYICIYRYNKTAAKGKEELKIDGQPFSAKESI